MKIKNLPEILAQLSRELQRAEDVDVDARRELQELHTRAAQVKAGDQTEVDWLQNRVKEVESQFAAEHPTIARVARELADALAKMGI
jgi:predicted  nucleic acid-binding Zn-ribbon protein